MNDLRIISGKSFPVDIVLAPGWWFHNEAITFDEDFFYNPLKRVEVEKQMEKALYKRWGKFGLGQNKDENLPIIGPIHLAAGYLLSEMLGCKVIYKQNTPPQVIPANKGELSLSEEAAFQSNAYKRFVQLFEQLKSQYGYIIGDLNWGGILNIALDIRGQALFMDMFDKPSEVKNFLKTIAAVIEKFTQRIAKETGSTSISVNRNVRHLDGPVFLHSECSHTMISVQDYKKFLFEYDDNWSCRFRPFGIHYCGTDPHRYAEAFAELSHLDFLDVGWGGDVIQLRKNLPETFFNIRLSPVEIINQFPHEIENTIYRLAKDSGNLYLTGFCCINMDENVTDDKITTIFETVKKLRDDYSSK